MKFSTLIRRVLTSIFVSVALSTCGVAEPVEPHSMHEVIASWKVAKTYQNDKNSVEKTRWHIQQGQYPGQANLHLGQAKSILSAQISRNPKDSEIWYLWARVLQHQHQFDEALQALATSLNLAPGNTNALLLKASILITQSKFTDAKKVCGKLIGRTDMLIVAACGLEADSYQGHLESAYKQLDQALSRHAVDKSEVNIWLLQLVADMAKRLSKFDLAAAWLGHYNLAEMPLSYLVLWADVQLALGENQQLLDVLGPIVEQAAFKDDPLLVRLSLAEQQLGKNSWRKQLDERMQLREQRQDIFHAADLALYYLALKPNPTKAMHWATINWQQAKQSDDKRLLELAIALQNNPQQTM